ncbi:MAG: hypothetical protein P8M17_13470 [Saprospiraceae bacterium]|nr:hypothetical protein [Saprospiraceae bacterium]MDG2419999.1 hypothetical protein [Saprospiraceae bacterium]
MQLPIEISVAPFNYVTLDWNEHRYSPMETYDLPHFDIHFYMISETQRDLTSPIDTIDFLPPNYLETPEGVPSMGTRMIDLESPKLLVLEYLLIPLFM